MRDERHRLQPELERLVLQRVRHPVLLLLQRQRALAQDRTPAARTVDSPCAAGVAAWPLLGPLGGGDAALRDAC